MAVRQLWLNDRKGIEDLTWVGSFLFLGSLWDFLKERDLLSSVGWFADGKASFHG